ncbi:MAG: ABC transporter ATP-binding protein [Thaumarchaeota archaeon]|nr:ABC transporter ATP-binding protein [Nitrososphaerota archaeon]
MEVLHGIDLEVRRGEIVAIIGPNGAGKSTVSNSIVGMADVFSGRITFDGFDITGMPTHKIVDLGIGYTPQLNNVFQSLSVRENLELGLFNLKDDVEGRIKRVLELFPEIRDKAGRPARVLSGGERQMLAVARAIISEPKLLILDEPTAALSPKAAQSLVKKILEIREMGLTILLVEQNVRRALGLADRAYVLVGGKIAYEGDAKKLLGDPLLLERLFFGVNA